MAHIHQQIRDHVATQVNAIGTLTGKVYKMRNHAIDDAKLPAAVVYTNTQQSSVITIGMMTARGSLELVVEIYVKGASATISDTLDELCVLVENALAADFTVNGLAKSCVLTGTEIDINVEGERAIASARLVYAVEYVTSIGDVETAQ